MKFLFSFLLLYCSFKVLADDLLIKKPLADFIMASHKRTS